MTEMERALARRRAMASGEIWADMIVDGKLWLGAGRDAENLSQLRSHGITHVLNVADDVPNFHEAEADLTYLCLRVADFGGGSRHAYPSAVTFVRDAWAASGRVLVHCANGSNRSATVTIAVCMDLLSLTLAEAWTLVCDRRKAAAPLADNRADLLQYESEQKGGVVTMAEYTPSTDSGGATGTGSAPRGGRLVPINTAAGKGEPACS